jgi:hypothetical protein
MAEDQTAMAPPPAVSIPGEFGAFGPSLSMSPAMTSASFNNGNFTDAPSSPGALASLPGALSSGVNSASQSLGNLASGINGMVGAGLSAIGNLPSALTSPEATSAPAPAMSFSNPTGAPSASPAAAALGNPAGETASLAGGADVAPVVRALRKMNNTPFGMASFIPQGSRPFTPTGFARGGSPNPYAFDDGGDVPFEVGDASAPLEERAAIHNAIAQLETSGRGVNGPKGAFANELYQQYRPFAQQYGAGEAGIQNYASQVLKANPNATFGDFYGGYVTSTGNPATARMQNLLTTTQPGARGAYANLMRNSPISPSTPLASLVGGGGGGNAPGAMAALNYDSTSPNAVLGKIANGQPAGGLPGAITNPPPGGGAQARSLGPPGAGPPGGIPGTTDPRQFPAWGAAAAETQPGGGAKGSNGPMFGKQGFLSNIMNDPRRMALIMAGLGAWTPQGIAGGFAQGAQFVQHQQSYDIQAKRLEQEANWHQQQMKETERYHTFEMTKPVPYNAGYDQYGQPLHGVLVPQRQSDGTFKWAPQTQEQPQTRSAPDSSFQVPGQQGQGQGTTTASLDQRTGEGDIPYNTRLVSGGPFDYIHGAPTIQKGMDVPEPQAVGDIAPGALKRDAESYALTGKLPPTRGTRGKVASDANDYRHAVQNYGDAILSSRGISPEQSADLWRSAPGYLRWVTGPDGRSTVAIGNVMRHTEILKEIAKEWNAGNLTPSNALKAKIATMFGSDAATNLEAAARIVAPETMKALGAIGAGGINERGEVKEGFSPSASMKQILGATEVTERLLGEQLEGKEGQAALAGVDHDHFKRAVGEKPYEILENLKKQPIGGGQQPAGTATKLAPIDQQALDWANSNPKDPRAAAIKKKLGVP